MLCLYVCTPTTYSLVWKNGAFFFFFFKTGTVPCTGDGDRFLSVMTVSCAHSLNILPLFCEVIWEYMFALSLSFKNILFLGDFLEQGLVYNGQKCLY